MTTKTDGSPLRRPIPMNCQISSDPGVREYTRNLKLAMPAYREATIQAAYARYVKEKEFRMKRAVAR